MAHDKERDSERTTIVTTDGGGRGNATMILVVALIVILLAVVFFSGAFDRTDDRNLNVDINAPDVNVIVPQTQVPVVTVPQTQVPANVDMNLTTPPTEPAENLSNTETSITNSG